MKYEVVVSFSDLKDNGYIYRVGDEFPRSGAVVSDDRIKELSTDKNVRGVALIKSTESETEEVLENETEEVLEKPRKNMRKKNAV